MELEFETWERSIPDSVREDPLWRMRAYRLYMFIGETAWRDVSLLARDQRTRSLSDQLYRALGSISANLAEGYSRSSGKDRAHSFEYALGSARESRDWYYKARHVIGDTTASLRMDLLSQIIRMLLSIIPAERSRQIREETGEYETTDNLIPDENSSTQYSIRSTE
jgi:four helix bundle protein